VKNLALACVLSFTLVSSACRTGRTPAAPPCDYTIVQLTTHPGNDMGPLIDDGNRILWTRTGVTSELFRYNPATDNSTLIVTGAASVRANASGQITWIAHDGEDPEIFFHDGSSVVQITDNSDFDNNPFISDAGGIVWTSQSGGSGGGSTDVYLYHGGLTTQITDTPDLDEYWPQINANGDITWAAATADGVDQEVFFRSGTTALTTQVTNNSTSDSAPVLNEQGDIAWFGGDGSGMEAFFRPATSGLTIQLTNADFLSGGVDINNNGYAVIGGLAQGESQPQVWLYDGSVTIQITSGLRAAKDPRINDDNHVIYWVNAPLPPAGPDDELYCYDPVAGAATQITDDTVSNDLRAEIGDGGYIAWEGNDTTGIDSEIFIGIPAGPDLAIGGLTFSPANPTTTQATTLTAVIRNIGGAPASASKALLRVSNEASGVEYDVPALAPGEEHLLERQVTLGVAQNYKALVTADSSTQVNELSEANNGAAIQFQVAP
jgi:hypothetical protein